jgi:hypothetical protein
MNCNATSDPLEQAADAALSTDLPAAPGGGREEQPLPSDLTPPPPDDGGLLPGFGPGARGVGAIASFAGMWHALLDGLSSSRRWAMAVVGMVMAVAVPGGVALAQPPAASQAIDVRQYKPGPGAYDVLGLHGARVGLDLALLASPLP